MTSTREPAIRRWSPAGVLPVEWPIASSESRGAPAPAASGANRLVRTMPRFMICTCPRPAVTVQHPILPTVNSRLPQQPR